MTTTDTTRTPTPSPDPVPRKDRTGLVVAASLLAGLVAAGLLVAVPFVPAEESAVTGAVLLGFALGWAVLASVSARSTDHPQRWAWVPTAFMGAGGLVLLVLPGVHEALQWVWPPALLALSVWMFVRVRREVRSRRQITPR